MRDFPEKPGPMYLWDKVEWVPGAEEALKSLYKKYIMIIATNAGASNTQDMIKALQRLGADKYFNYFFSSKDLGYSKPDVRFFKSISKKTGIAPEKCIMIGNVYEKDIIGAKKSGMKTVFFNELIIKRDFPKADKIINNLNELVYSIDYFC